MSTNLSDIDLSQLKLAKSGKSVKIMYNKEPLQLVTGKMYMPFGVKINTNSYSSFTNCHIDCSLNQSNSEISVKYKDCLEALDKRIIELIQESLHLFKTDSDYESDDIHNIYGSILRENKTYPKLMKISLPRDKNGNFDFVIFNKQKEQLTINNDDKLVDTLCKGKIFKGIIECAKIWYFKGRFGTTWNLTQLKFVENNSSTDIDAVNQNTSQAHVYMMLDD